MHETLSLNSTLTQQVLVTMKLKSTFTCAHEKVKNQLVVIECLHVQVHSCNGTTADLWSGDGRKRLSKPTVSSARSEVSSHCIHGEKGGII